MPRKRTLPKGVRLYSNGYQTFGKVNGKQIPRRSWPIDTPIEAMEDWLRVQRKIHGGKSATGFAADINTYCERKAALASIKLRRQHLEFFAAQLGADRSRHSIEAADLDRLFANLEKGGMLDADGIPMPPMKVSTVHNYRASIRAFFYVMDPDRVNPVRHTSIPKLPPGAAKGRTMDVIESILAKMTDRGLAKVRATVIAYTGIPPALLREVKSTDLLPSPLAPTEVRIPPRKKGKGVEARTLPLTDDGAAAFVAFHRANAYGKFATCGLNAAFKRAARKADVHGITLYALRHSFLTQMYRVTEDQATVAEFAMHAKNSPLTAQYCAAAREDVNAAAVAAYNASSRKRRQAQAGASTSTQPAGIDWNALEAALPPEVLAQVRAALAAALPAAA